jgi:hypothetical protein
VCLVFVCGRSGGWVSVLLVFCLWGFVLPDILVLQKQNTQHRKLK